MDVTLRTVSLNWGIDSVPDRVGSQADVQGLTNGRVVESTIDG